MLKATRGVARRWGRFGITTRLMVGHTLLLVVIIGAIVFQSDRVITQRLERSLNVELTDEVIEYSSAANSRPAGQDLTAFTVSYLQSHPPGRNFLVVLGVAGNTTNPAGPLASRPSAFLAHVAPVRAWTVTPPARPTLLRVHVNGGAYRVLGSPVMIDGKRAATFVAAANLASLNPDRTEQLAIAALEGLGALLAATAGGFLLLRRVLRTVNRVTQAAKDARSGDLAQRLPYDGPDDEVGRLAQTMDEMLTRLDTSFTAQRRLLADVSHQLRTPLTVARGHLEVLARSKAATPVDQSETVALVIDELAQMSLMVERLLLLGQALEPDFLAEEMFELRPLLEELFDAARVMAHRVWVLEPVVDVAVRGDRAKLRGALLNLIDNAVKATTEEDSITVSAAVQGDRLLLQVSDTGRGISGEEQSVVFDRFRRSAGSSYGGSGLGLAIAKAVAEGHGGWISLDSAPGKGTRVTIALPGHRLVPLPSGVAMAGQRL